MKKNLIKISLILFYSLLILSVFSNLVYASNFVGNLNEFEDGENPIETEGNKVRDTVITLVRVVAVGTAIIMILVLGMKYMVSAPGDRADIKKHLIAYVIGAFIVFGSATILKILIDLAEKFN